MLVGIDICNTLADINYVLEKELGRNPNPSSYYHPKVESGYFKNNLWIFDEAPSIEYSRDVLENLSGKCQVVYITARPVESRDITSRWLKRNGYPKGELLFTQDKLKVAVKLGVSLAIDDAPNELTRYISGNIPVWTKAQPYNVGYLNRFEWIEKLKIS